MPVRDRLCLYFNTLCLSSIPCACLQYVVPVLNTLCPSPIRCACPKYSVLVLDTLCQCSIGCACPRYTVPVLNTLSWPFAVPVPIRNRILTLILLYKMPIVSFFQRLTCIFFFTGRSYHTTPTKQIVTYCAWQTNVPLLWGSC